MDTKSKTYEDDEEFLEMLNKMRNTQLNSTLLESPASKKYGLSPLAGSPCSPVCVKTPKYKGLLSRKCPAMKILNFSQVDEDADNDAIENNNVSEELDLNKTYSSKTMDHKQLSIMLDALKDIDDD